VKITKPGDAKKYELPPMTCPTCGTEFIANRADLEPVDRWDIPGGGKPPGQDQGRLRAVPELRVTGLSADGGANRVNRPNLGTVFGRSAMISFIAVIAWLIGSIPEMEE
jgi:hypothetical protein